MSAVPVPAAVGEVTGRIATIRAQIGVRPTSGPDSPGAATAFAKELDGAVAQTERRAMAGGASTAGTKALRAGDVTTAGTKTHRPGDVTGDTVVNTAKKYLGVPYVWGGTSPSGLDCSGLVQITFKELGVELPRVSRDQATVGDPVASIDDARPGDLIAFGTPVNHIAIYAGDGKILEAPEPGKNVRIVDMFREPVAIRRVVPAGDGSATAPATNRGAAASVDTADGGVDGAADVAVTTALGIPPGFMKMWDNVTLDDVPRAIPLSALGIGTTSPAVASGAAAGLSATALTSAGLSEAVASFADQFAAAESSFNLPSGLLAAVAQAESAGRPDAVSPAGAQGLMQLMPGTARALGVHDPFDPAQAIRGAAQYLSDQLAAFDGSVDLAVAAYNAGPGAVRRYGGIPPYTETQNYVSTINDMMARLT